MNAPGGKPEQQGDIRAAALYMLVAILLILFNKATFSYYSFGAPNVLTLSQNVCSLLFLLACKKGKLIEFHDFSLRNLGKMLLLGLTFILYMVFGMVAMKVVSIPMYTTLRRTTVVFVMLLEWLISRKTSTATTKASVGLMVLGALLAGLHDLNFDLFAYVIVVIYNLCTALYLVLINRIATAEKSRPVAVRMEKYDLMYYNNLVSIPVLLLVVAATGEGAAARDCPYWNDPGFVLSVFASSVLAFVLNYAIFWNTSVNSALTQTVSGQAKDVLVVLAGFVMFDDASPELLNVLGVGVGFAGSIFYASSKVLPWRTIERGLARLGLGDFGDDRKKDDDRLTLDAPASASASVSVAHAEGGDGMGAGGGSAGGPLLPFTNRGGAEADQTEERASLLQQAPQRQSSPLLSPYHNASLSATPGTGSNAYGFSSGPSSAQSTPTPGPSPQPYARFDAALPLHMQALGPQAFASRHAQ